MLDDLTIPVHVGPWTLDDWLALPPSHMRIELVDGMLVVNSMEAVPNRRLMGRASCRTQFLPRWRLCPTWGPPSPSHAV